MSVCISFLVIGPEQKWNKCYFICEDLIPRLTTLKRKWIQFSSIFRCMSQFLGILLVFRLFCLFACQVQHFTPTLFLHSCRCSSIFKLSLLLTVVSFKPTSQINSMVVCTEHEYKLIRHLINWKDVALWQPKSM